MFILLGGMVTSKAGVPPWRYDGIGATLGMSVEIVRGCKHAFDVNAGNVFFVMPCTKQFMY